MNSVVNAMPIYNHRQHVLSDWLAELDQRSQLREVDEDTNMITVVSTPHRHHRVRHPIQPGGGNNLGRG